MDLNDYTAGKQITELVISETSVLQTDDFVFKIIDVEEPTDLNEAIIGIELTKHQIPNTVRTYGYTNNFDQLLPLLPGEPGAYDNSICIVMEKLNGASLQQFVVDQHFFAIKVVKSMDQLMNRIKALIVDFIKGYSVAYHKLAFTHYDLHSGNIIVVVDKAIMFDFGVSSIAGLEGPNWAYDMCRLFTSLWRTTVPTQFRTTEAGRAIFNMAFATQLDLNAYDDVEHVYGLIHNYINQYPARFKQQDIDWIAKIINKYRRSVAFPTDHCVLRDFFVYGLRFFELGPDDQWLAEFHDDPVAFKDVTKQEVRPIEAFVEHLLAFNDHD